MIKLDIFSDPICPWCYIGKTNLDRALEQRPDHPFVIEWHPFQLNPDMPREGMDRRTYLEAKFGGKDGAVQAYAPVVEHAKTAGLDINFEAMQRTPNTLDAHRLILWAGIEGRQTAVISSLFKAYFVEGLDIGELVATTPHIEFGEEEFSPEEARNAVEMFGGREIRERNVAVCLARPRTASFVKQP